MGIANAGLSQIILGSTRARIAREARTDQDGSSTAFCIDTDGLPVIGMPAADQAAEVTLRLPLAAQRATLLMAGTAAPLAAGTPARVRFERFFPGSDAVPHKLTPLRCVFELADGGTQDQPYATLDLACPFPDGAEQRMVEHMNADHVDAMRAYCSHAGIDCRDDEPRMIAVDHHGFFLRVGEALTRFAFDQRCGSPLDVRTALVQQAQRARADTAAHTTAGH